MDEDDGDRLHTVTSRLHTLNEIGRVVSAALDLGTLYETIYRQIASVMDASLFFLGIVRPELGIVELPYMREEGQLYVDQRMPHGNSVTSLVIDRGTPLLFDTDEEYRAYVEQNSLPDITLGEQIPESVLIVPLNTGSRTIGALSAQSMRPYAYTEDDVQTLSVIASQAAVAITNAALYQQSQDNVRQMEALLQVARTVNSSLDLQSVLDSVLTSIRAVLPYYIATILLPNEREQALEIKGVAGSLEGLDLDLLRRLKIPFGEGVTGTAYATCEPLVIQDTSNFPRDNLISFGTRSELALPLKRGEEVIGVLDIEREEPDGFSADDMNLLSLFASQAAIAIENARLYAEQEQRVDELQTIESIVRKLTPLQEIPAIAEVVETELKRLIDYHAARLFFLDASHGILLPIKFAGPETADYRLRVGEGLAGWVAQQGESVIIENSLQDPRVVHIPGTPRREESVMGVPLIFEGRVQGVITLSALGVGQFDENALRLLEIVAGQTAIVFDRARLYDELRTEAITDPLTKLYNRRYLVQRLKEEGARAGRSGGTLAAIMLDLDKFKMVNDRFGHDAGDVVLQAVAGIIRAVVRGEDIVARYGGEEFCVLLPGISDGEVELVAERLRAMIAGQRLPAEAAVERVTVSVGVAMRLPDDESTELFSRADAAMYEAKRLGGNRVFWALPHGFVAMGEFVP